MKQVVKVSSLLICVLILVPHTVLAAWWNPFSWFQKDTTVTEVENYSTLNIEPSQTNVEPGNNEDSNRTEIIEKIVEKTIQIDNPELQKQVNNLIRENQNLKNQVASLSSELNSCKLVEEKNAATETKYSDFKFQYKFEENIITLLHSTSREIKIKKAKFDLWQNYSETLLSTLNEVGASLKIQIDGREYNLEKIDQGSTFSFVYVGSGIPITGSEGIKMKIVNSNGTIFRVYPDWSQWEIWDYTTGKPVKINY